MEIMVTTIAFHPMASLAHSTPFARLRALFALWRSRAYDREQLAKWDDRDLHDAGISRSVLEYELNKPFWRG